MNTKNCHIDNIASWCAMIWFVLIIDACFTWFLSDNIRNFIGTILIICATNFLLKSGQLEITRNRQYLCLTIFTLFSFMCFIKDTYISSPFIYIPLMCIIFWSREVILKFYHKFRKFIVFYAVLSILVTILFFSDAYVHIPHLVLPAQDYVQESLGYSNYFYGLFSIAVPDTEWLSFYRASGPLREGGHFSIFLGFTYFVEKIVYGKRNIWLIICGVLTLSPNFILFFVVTEFYCAITNKTIFKLLLLLGSSVVILIVSFILSPDEIKDEIIRIVLERTLENSIENAESDGFMALLDGRTNDIGMQTYNHFSRNGSTLDYLLGYDYTRIPDELVLSDIRVLILRYGYIGLTLFLLCTFIFSLGSRCKEFCVTLFVLAMGVMLQRAWMFEQTYIWTIMYMSTNAYYLTNIEKATSYE